MYSNIYYSPEEYGLESVFDVDKSDGCYQFDQFVIWKDGETYFWASDAGCSCPSPFEEMGRNSLSQGSLREAINDALAWVKSDAESDYSWSDDARAARKRIEEFRDAQGL
jgi:hypothetical protein